MNNPFNFDTYSSPPQHHIIGGDYDFNSNTKSVSSLIKKNNSTPFLHLNQNTENIVNQWDSNHIMLYELNQKNLSQYISSNYMIYQPYSLGNIEYPHRSNIISDNNNINNDNIQSQDHQFSFLRSKIT